MNRSIYTYVVNHGDESPPITAGMKINGGSLEAVQFDDALLKLEEMENFLNEIRDKTSCGQTKYAIDDFLN